MTDYIERSVQGVVDEFPPFTAGQVLRINGRSYQDWLDALRPASERHKVCSWCCETVGAALDADPCPCGFLLYGLTMGLDSTCRVILLGRVSEAPSVAVRPSDDDSAAREQRRAVSGLRQAVDRSVGALGWDSTALLLPRFLGSHPQPEGSSWQVTDEPAGITLKPTSKEKQ